MRLPPSSLPRSRIIAPTREIAQGGPSGRETPRLSRAAIADRRSPRFFTLALALYIAVVVGRLHEVIPIFARLYFGKISLGLLIVGLFVDGPHVALRPALKTRTAKCLGV